MMSFPCQIYFSGGECVFVGAVTSIEAEEEKRQLASLLSP